jgi:hypothetical protein
MTGRAVSSSKGSLKRLVRTIIGVPITNEEREAVSSFFLQHKLQDIRQANPNMKDDELLNTAKQSIIDDVNQLLHQIAARSQTLLAVIALVIGIFVQISEPSGNLRKICVLWALLSLSLFYNIWIFYGKSHNYENAGLEYVQTLRLNYQRCVIFNSNVLFSFIMAVACAVVYFNTKPTAPNIETELILHPAEPASSHARRQLAEGMIVTPTRASAGSTRFPTDS